MGRSGLLATCSEDKLRDDVLLVSEDMLLLMRLRSCARTMEPLEVSLQTRETIAKKHLKKTLYLGMGHSSPKIWVIKYYTFIFDTKCLINSQHLHRTYVFLLEIKKYAIRISNISPESQRVLVTLQSAFVFPVLD